MLADSVRLALPAEAPQLAAIQRRVWLQQLPQDLARSVLEGIDLDEMTTSWHAAIVRPPLAQFRVLAAVTEERVTGFAAVGPSDDPDDDDVELPEDIALPWPDVERIKAWWMEHRSEFTPGQKLFLGKPITPEHCIHVLKTGYQRQRVIAAHYRCLIQPGTVLFPTSAPAWRQQKLLAAM